MNRKRVSRLLSACCLGMEDSSTSGRVGKLATLRRRQRRVRQKLRVALGRGGHPDLDRGMGVGAVDSATPPTAAARPVASVLPRARSPVEAEVALPVSIGPAIYAPTATLELHPNSVVAADEQGPQRFLYLTQRFLYHLRRGYIPNPIPLSLVNIVEHGNDFPAMTFGGPSGSNVVFYDQE